MLQQTRVLMIDDNWDFARLVKLNLESTGKYRVRVEQRSTNALRAAFEFRPHIILLDVIMPGMDGAEVCSLLQEDIMFSHIPIIFVTAAVSKQSVEKQRELTGGRPLLVKPVGVDELIECMEQVLADTAEHDYTEPSVPDADDPSSETLL